MITYEEFLGECRRIFSLNPEINAPNEEQTAKLYRLTEVMLEVNEHMNLTAITDCSQIILKHYVDSLSVSEYIPQNAKIIDIGCGAGFPSLPLAICRPDVRIVALDSTAKRILKIFTICAFKHNFAIFAKKNFLHKYYFLTPFVHFVISFACQVIHLQGSLFQ